MATLPCISVAQQQSGTEREIEANGRTFQQIFDSLTVGLIKSRIPYSYLYNRVFPWTQLDEWQDGDTTSMYGLFQSWFDVAQSYVGSKGITYRYEIMRDSVAAQKRKLQLPVLALRNNFALLDSNAVADGRLDTSRGLIADNGQGLPPYLSRSASLSGIATDEVDSGVTFMLRICPQAAIC